MISKSDLCVNLFLLMATLSMTNAQDSINYGTCLTPNAERATCVSLLQCTFIYNILIKTPLMDADKIFLKQSQCGMNNGTVLVCCPKRYKSAQPQSEPAVIGTRSSLPEPGVCASNVFSSRIYDGNITRIDEYPWLARIEYDRADNTTGYHCGASLISDRYILTAAHCIKGIPKHFTPIRVRLGEWDTRTNPDCEKDVNGYLNCADPHVDVPIEETIVHPKYAADEINQYYDIALLRLSHKVPYSDFIRPICLPIKESLKRSTFEGTVMDVAGWGQTETGSSSDVKLKASIPVVHLDECQRTHGQFKRNLQSSQICAGGLQGIDSCNGDSGGPLIGFDTSNKLYFFIAGIVSYGSTPCGLKGWPGVYTRVGDYVDWIQQNV